MSIYPYILGQGRSGDVIAKTLGMLAQAHPDWNISSPTMLKRGSDFSEIKSPQQSLLCVANPHGLHAEAILKASALGIGAILCEKPACVNLKQVSLLREVKTPTAILHGYRQTWGLQTIKQHLLSGAVGDIISIEGRYWQSSAADRALSEFPAKMGWKDDSTLSGEFDTYLDIATHWVDAVTFLYGKMPKEINGWRSYTNADSPHRDTHIQLCLNFENGRGFGSISKTVHGKNNHFEINIIGSKKSLTWEFQKPDELVIGEGKDLRILSRKTQAFGSQLPPFHGMGWTEGYLEITRNLLSHAFLRNKTEYPRLSENLDLLESMLKVSWKN